MRISNTEQNEQNPSFSENKGNKQAIGLRGEDLSSLYFTHPRHLPCLYLSSSLMLHIAYVSSSHSSTPNHSQPVSQFLPPQETSNCNMKGPFSSFHRSSVTILKKGGGQGSKVRMKKCPSLYTTGTKKLSAPQYPRFIFFKRHAIIGCIHTYIHH